MLTGEWGESLALWSRRTLAIRNGAAMSTHDSRPLDVLYVKPKRGRHGCL